MRKETLVSLLKFTGFGLLGGGVGALYLGAFVFNELLIELMILSVVLTMIGAPCLGFYLYYGGKIEIYRSRLFRIGFSLFIGGLSLIIISGGGLESIWEFWIMELGIALTWAGIIMFGVSIRKVKKEQND